MLGASDGLQGDGIMNKSRVWLIILSVIFWLSAASQAPSIEQQQLVFLTPEEASKLILTEEEWQRPIHELFAPYDSGGLYYASSSGYGVGPEIIVQTPKVEKRNTGPTIETKTPLDLIVFFKKSPDPVDMKTLNVIAKKGIFTKSLTSRLKPYIQGTSIVAKKVAIPAGKFLIQISIADSNGAKTVETYRLKIFNHTDSRY
jgi:hypothetical protein